MFDAERYIAEFQAMEHGTPRLRAIKKAYTAADEAHNDEWSFQFRYRYLNESTFESDDVDAMIVFPEMVALYDGSEELQADDDCFHNLMWGFKLVIENATDFHHISLEQIDGFMADFKRRLEENGKSLRTYYYLREKISEYFGNLLPAEEYGKYRDIEPDDLRDCAACEVSHDVRMALLLGQPERAKELGKPIFSGELRCGNVPQNTYAAWIRYDIRHGDYGDARMLARRLWPMVRHEMDKLGEIGALLHYCSAANRSLGMTVFRHEVRNFANCRNHRMRLAFAEGAYRLFSKVKVESFQMLMPRECPFWNEDHSYETAKLRDYFFAEAKSLAEKFDARNGNTRCMDALLAEDPAYDEDAVDLVHGDADMSASSIAAVCTTLPDELTGESISRQLDADGRFKVVMQQADAQKGLIALQIAEGDGSANLHQVLIFCQPVAPVEEFRAASPVPQDLKKAVSEAEGMVVCMMPFEDIQPDLALHFQLKLLNLICPEAIAYLDLSRAKLLPAGWVAMTAHSDVPPLVDYLYNLQIQAMPDSDAIWISTRGLNCCGMRELEIFDANKQNFARYCDLICFTAERMLLRGELPIAGEPFTVVRKTDGSEVVCTWVPVSEAERDYPDSDAAGYAVRKYCLGDENAQYNDAVLYLYDGEAADGTQKRKRLNALTEADFEKFLYGNYVATSRKIAALAQERCGIFAALLEKFPNNAFVCVQLDNTNRDEIWLKATKVEDGTVTGILTATCEAGEEGSSYQTTPEHLTDFSVRVNEQLVIYPNTAYIALEME